MTTLVLGVHDFPYAGLFHTKAGKRKKGISKAQAAYGVRKNKDTGESESINTGDVALILEARYHVMRAFYELEKPGIIAAIEKSAVGAVINMCAGQPGPINLLAQATSDIETAFKQGLSAKVLDGRTYPGTTPTAASIRGVSHRFKQPYARRASRPSFIDTGLYQSSMFAWTED